MKIKLTYPLKIFKVPSRSQKGVVYDVYLYSDGSLECDCWAGLCKRECWHKKRVREYLKKKENEKS